MKWAITLALIAATGLSACASRPKPVDLPGPQVAPSAPEESRPREAAPPVAASISQLQSEFETNAGDRVFFALDSHLLDPDARAGLDRQAAWLVRHPSVQVLIEGNCDERGTREYNLALGARRADSVMAYLAQKGVGAGRMRSISYGKERPIDPGANESAWSRNRNGHTVLIALDGR